jgi:Spy/CpxP family protein refolding chaperone
MRKLIVICAIAAGIVLAQTATTTSTTTTAPPRARVLKRLVQTLALTDDQKQQAKTILQTARTQAQPLAQQLQADRQALATAIQAGDTAAIQSLSAKMGTLRGQVLAIRAQGMAQFFALLTPDQKTKAEDFLRKSSRCWARGRPGAVTPLGSRSRHTRRSQSRPPGIAEPGSPTRHLPTTTEALSLFRSPPPSPIGIS